MSCVVEEHLVRMADGVELYTLVQRPEEPGRYPVKLWRNPYVSREVDLESARRAELRGYVHVSQHCRGCGRSGGDCIPYINERQDGLDTLAWLRRQPFYGGEVYPVGGSYLSSVHFSYLDTCPADVRGAVLPVQDCCRYNVLYRNGFFKANLHGGWFVSMYRKNSGLTKNYAPETFRTLPLAGVTTSIFGERCAQLEEELAHPDPDDPFYATPDGGVHYGRALKELQAPVLLVTAFHDIYTEGILDMWDSLTPEQRRLCALVVTPYEHSFNYNERNSPMHFPNAGLDEVDPDYAHEWIEHVRTGAPLSFIRPGETLYYTLWENAWHHAPRLADGPRTRTCALLADRTLGESGGPGGDITYVYNPYAPATFEGGCCNTFGGMRPQPAPNSRYDIVSFLGAPMTETTVIEGAMDVELTVRSDCPDTCFYVRLSAVKEGVAYGLRDDITSICRQHPDYRPGETVRLRFHLAPHSFQLSPGDSLRLDVSSSCVPHYTVHTNRRGQQHLQTGADIAHNTIVAGASTLTWHER